AQKTLSGERRRRRSLASFRRTPYFADALTLFELRVAATGEHEELLEKWQSGEEIELPEGTPSEPSESAGAADGEKRGRRRRRRRRGGRGGNGPESNGAPPSGGSADS